MPELRDFLLGKAGSWEVETLEEHITDCPACQARMGGIEANDEIVLALRSGRCSSMAARADGGAGDDSPTGGMAVSAGAAAIAEQLLARLKRIPEGLDHTVTGNQSEFTPAVEGSPASTETMLVNSTPGETALAAAPASRLGRYQLTAVLGRGGMGTVYQAWDPLLERQVAIKVPRTELLANRKVRDRMLQEARAAAAVVDDHIVPIHAVEESDGTPFLVMPLLKGMTLKQSTEGSRPPSVDEILRIGREAATGLAAAHRHGLLHCDLKPGNLWLEAPTGRVKLLDFGLAVPFEEDGPEPVGGSGTPGYLAPEQVRHGSLDPRTDVFGLGCVLFQLATGRLPFQGSAAMRPFWTVMGESPPPLNTIRPEVPEPLSDLVGRMLDRDPGGRPADGAAVLETFLAIEAERRAIATSRQRRRTWLGIAAATLVGGGGMAVWAVWFGPRVPEDVLMRITVSNPSTGVVLVRDGQERLIAPGGPTTISLAPGLYEVRPDTSRPDWSIVPDSLVVEPDLLSHEVTLSPYGELARRRSHSLAGTGVLFRADQVASWAISVGQDRRLVSWRVDAEPASAVQGIDLPHEGKCLALSADQTRIYTAGGNRQPPAALGVYRWDARTLTEAGQLEGSERITQALDCSSDGRWIAAADADGVHLWDSGGVLAAKLVLETGDSVWSVRWNAASDQLAAVGMSGQFAVWTCERDRFRLSRHGRCGTRDLRSVVWWGETLLLAGDDGTVWQVAGNAAETRSVAAVTGGIQALALTDDGAWLLAGEHSGKIGLWATADWRRRGVLSGHVDAVTSVAIEPGSRRAISTGRDGTVRLWQLPVRKKEAVAKK